MTDVTATLLRLLIEKTRENKLEWEEAVKGIHFCVFGNYRIVIRYFRPYYYGYG